MNTDQCAWMRISFFSQNGEHNLGLENLLNPLNNFLSAMEATGNVNITKLINGLISLTMFLRVFNREGKSI